MSYYQKLWKNLGEIRRAMIETKGTPEHEKWVIMYRWAKQEMEKHSTVCETASA